MNRDRRQEIKASGQSRNFGLPATPELSVLLPTCNREEALQRTFLALEKQSVEVGLFEIIVVDDGSSDGTVEVLNRFAETTDSRFSYAILKENGGPARARNIGLSICRGCVILIIGDDIEPEVSLLEKHLLYHRQKPGEEYALLGYVSFPDALQPNAFMRWLEKDGRKYFFNYADLSPNQQAGPIFFYTCNVSVKASLLDRSGWFDESFPFASHEDLELGYRLADKGMQLVYDPSARGSHWHMLSVRGIARRVYLMGYSAVLFWQKVDEKGGWLKKVVRRMLAWFSTTPPVIGLWSRLHRKQYQEEKSYPVQWHILLFLSFFIGLSDSLKKESLRL